MATDASLTIQKSPYLGNCSTDRQEIW